MTNCVELIKMGRRGLLLIFMLVLFVGRAAGQCTLVSAPLTDAQEVCDGTAITDITYSLSDATGATVTGLPTGLSYNFTDTEVTISGTPTGSGTYDYTVTLSHATTPCTSEGTIVVNDLLPVSVSIGVSANPVCDNTTVTCTATPGNGGATPSYQWYNGSIPAGTNSPIYSYEPGNGDEITVVMTSGETCTTGNPATSNEITMTVNPILPVSVSISASDNPVCTGTAVTFTATPANGGVTPAYQWYKGAAAVGTNSQTYSYTPANGDVITVRLTSGETCTSGNPATSNPVTMTVYSSVPARPGTITGSTTVCQGQTGVNYSINPVDNALNYEWYVPAVDGTIISGQGTTEIFVDFAGGASDHTISVKAENTCGFGSTKTLDITVKLLPVATISGTTTICQNAGSPQITFNNPQSKAVTITYNINGANQTSINVASNDHDHVSAPTTTSGTFTYTLVSVKYQTGTLCSNIISGTATVTVTPTVGTPTPITVSAGSDPTCQLTNGTTTTTYTTSASNSTGFNWSLSNGSAGSIDPASGVMTWANGFSGSVNIRVTASGCGTSSQVIRAVTITPAVGAPTAILVASGIEPTCQLTDGTTTTTYSTTASNSTGFNWSLSNGSAGSIDPASGVMAWANGFSGSVNIQVTAGGCGISSQVIRAVNVTPHVGNPASISISAGIEPTCQLTNNTTTTTYATSATNSTGYNWSISNILAGSIDPSSGVMTWANGFSGNVNIQVTATGCNSTSPQVIRTVSITPAVGTPVSITVSGGSDPNCLLSGGTTMTIYSTTATNSTGFNWSLSDVAAGSINAASGLMTWANGFSGSVNIQVTANGCGTSSQVNRTVTIHPLPVITISGPATPRITSTGNIYETQSGMSGYIWTVSGGGAGTPAGNTIEVAWNTSGNQSVSVNYIDTEGCTAIIPKIYNVAVKQIPSASNAVISGYPALGNPLTGSYNYTDGSDGTDNSTYRWLRNGTFPIPLATNTVYVPTADDVNNSLTFEVTPVSSIGPPETGLSIKSSPTELVEDLTGVPVADEVCIEGIRAEGNTVSGEYRYTFSKAEGTSTYRWLRRDILTGSDIVIDTTRQYTLTAEDIDDSKEIIFEVTPVSSNLTPITGVTEQSRPLARILIPKAEFSISESDLTLNANEPGGVFSGTGVTGNIFSPKTAGSAGSPYTITYLLNIVNTASSCSQQASKVVIVNPNVSSFDGFNSVYCHDSGPDVITVTGYPTGAAILGFTITDADGIISQSGASVTIDPGRMRPGVYKDILYFSYNFNSTFYQISQAFHIDSVGTAVRLINLDTAYCQGDTKKYISVEGVYPAGGIAAWTGDILSDTKAASAYADPSLGTPGQSYPVTYQYKSPSGCFSKLLTPESVKINPLPNASFTLDPTYNIDGGQVTLVPVQTGGAFTGYGVTGNKLIPDIAGLGEHEIKYSITDENHCSANLGLKTTIRKAQGNFIDIPSVICYEDTTYIVKVTGSPKGVTVTGFTNTKNTLVYSTGDTIAYYNVPAAGAGLDTLFFSYKWDGVGYSISKTINVDNLGQVRIKNLTPGEIICDNRAPYELFPSIIGGIFTGPVSGGYLDPSKATGSTSVSYTYTNLKTGCSTSTTVPVTIYPAPKVAFSTVDVCIENNSDITRFTNETTSTDSIQSWAWEFFDVDGLHPGTDQDAGYLYKTGGLHKVILTATTINGCSDKKELTVDLGIKPVADFYWKNDCMHPNDSISLFDTTFSISLIASQSWQLFDGTEFSTKKKTKYLKADTGYLRIQYVVNTSFTNCSDTVIKDVFIHPAITIPADGYFQNFEAGKSGWVKGEITGNNWSFGKPGRPVINSASSGENAWFTWFDTTAIKKESSSIESPCFDFRGTERPIINLKLLKRFQKERDGAALQYKIGDDKEWKYVGTIEDGIEWFNSAIISGKPGGGQLGWTTMDDPDNDWVESSHTLDELKGKEDVKFRIAYGSDGIIAGRDSIIYGIAFDDIWLGERSRNVLLEHFANTSSAESSSATAMVNEIALNNPRDVINIQYHTNFPGFDSYYNDNPGEASARILFYGLQRAPYSFIDGGYDNHIYASQYNYTIADIDSKEVTRRSLINPLFSITLESDTAKGVLTVNGQLKALGDIKTENLTLYIAVTEKQNNEQTGAGGEKIFYNVFRKFIPDAGGINLDTTWTTGKVFTFSNLSWAISKIRSSSDIEVIAFVQNNISKEVYQAFSIIKFNIVNGIEKLFRERGNQFTLYPNPAVDRITVSFKEPLKQTTDIRIYDLQGIMISSYKAGSGSGEFRIEKAGLKPGIYLVRVSVKGSDIGFKKLIVSGN